MARNDKSSVDQPNARRGIQSVEVAFRLLTALQSSSRAVALKDIATLAGLSVSAANNYLVSLVRTGLAAADAKAGFYKLGPAALGLGMSAIQQIDGFDIMRQEVTNLCDETKRSTAVTAWTADGPVSLFKQDGEMRGAFEMRTGLISLLTTAAGNVFVACLQMAELRHLIEQENDADPDELQSKMRAELHRKGFLTTRRDDMIGYVSVAAPVWNWNGDVRFVISIVGNRNTVSTDRKSEQVAALLRSAARATKSLGGRASQTRF